ncbi:MAG: BON domain-containing protein, partial [Acidobacteriota bacterium]|nr:BON domain-containing protein [Acidobacteriota bacterium]
MRRLSQLALTIIVAAAAACASSDPGITTAVKTKLAADDTVKAYQIDVDTQGGAVTLTGVVETDAAKARAIELARGTDGVSSVTDRLMVNALATPDARAREAGGDAAAATSAATASASGSSHAPPASRSGADSGQ